MEPAGSSRESTAPSRSDTDRSQKERIEDLIKSLEGDRDIFGLIYGKVGDWHLAGDLEQETFLRVWFKRDQFDPTKDGRAWVKTIACNLTCDYLRSKNNGNQLELQSLCDGQSEPVDRNTIAPLDRLMEEELHAKFDRLVRQLDEDDRDLYQLRCKDMPFKEIAERTGRTEAAVRAAYVRLCECLHSALTRRDSDGTS